MSRIRRRQPVAGRARIVAFTTMKYNQTATTGRSGHPARLHHGELPGQFRNWFYALVSAEHDDAATGITAVQNASRPRVCEVTNMVTKCTRLPEMPSNLSSAADTGGEIKDPKGEGTAVQRHRRR